LEGAIRRCSWGRDLMDRSDIFRVASQSDPMSRSAGIATGCYRAPSSGGKHRACMDRLVELLIEKETSMGD